MMLPVEEGHLHVVDLGRGTPMLMHDGWVASWSLWLPLIERLQDRWRCIAYDHRGTGASTVPPDGITQSALVDDVFRVLDARGVDRTVIAGESLGSMVCLSAVLRDPSRFLGLVMIGGFPRTDQRTADAEKHERALFSNWPKYVEDFVSACLPEPDSGPLHRLGRQTLLPAGPEAATRMNAAHAGIEPPLVDVSLPTLVVHGALDAIAPPDGARELVQRIPDAELVMVDDAGHVPILTRPEVVAAAVEEWWGRVAPG